MSDASEAALRRARHAWIPYASLFAVGTIVVLDWLTPAGIVVGILLCLPIVATALGDDTRTPWIVGAAAISGFAVAAIFGRGPIVPAIVWAPNRIFAFLTLLGSLALAVLVQRARARAATERARAERASDLNRLLLSLLAHDMRSPLAMAVQALEYVHSAEDTGVPADPALLSDVEQRLRRGLAAIDRTLAIAPGPGAPAPGEVERRLSGRELLAELESEARSFESEATARGKTIEVALTGDPGILYVLDPLLARQALAILVDNAVRHAARGSIRVTGSVIGDELRLIVADDGPARNPTPDAAAGSGIGLSLCRALISRAGGELEKLDQGPGTNLLLRLPVTRV